METVRVFFAKEGRLKYISHLDVTRCLSRVFNRCGLPIWYTQGYNPHPYLTFALPLPLGVDSRCESFDFRLTDATDYQTVQDSLNAALPEDLRVLRAAAPVYGPEAICWADYRLTFRDSDTAVAEQLQCFLAEPHLPVIKKTKKGEQQVDLKEKMTVLRVEGSPEKTVLEVRLPAGGTLNWSPMLVTGAFCERLGREPYWTGLERIAILTEDFSPFC